MRPQRDRAPKNRKREAGRPFASPQTLKTIGAVFRVLTGLKILRSERLEIFPGNVAGFGMSEGEVRRLRVADAEINSDAVRLLRESLERALAGDVIGVAIIEVRRARTVATAVSKSATYHELNSGAARLAAMLATSPDDEP